MPPAVLTRGYNRSHNVSFRDETYSLTKGSSLWELAPILAALCSPENYLLFRDDFLDVNTVATSGRWKITKDGSVTQTILDRKGGWLNAVTDVNDNDEVYVASQAESFLFEASKPVWFEAQVELTEAATNKANILVGFVDVAGANSLLDNGGGPPASYSGAVWFKVDSGTVWQFETSNAGTQSTTTSAGAFASATTYRLGMIFDPNDGITGKVTPYLNGTAGTVKDITLASLTEMHLCFGVKAGSAAAETLKVDWVHVLAVR